MVVPNSVLARCSITPTDSALTVTVSVEAPTCSVSFCGQRLVHVQLEYRQRDVS